uniref:troponin C, body wall muscle n=1 Tax=Ciona intestinalis TaxID=7719 RepID=UPI00006A5403|nr:troponin C, body wall muscle [Ciona intestinalis]|eukprot:XP_002124306.1 troponin C, body wall muscle [Ciona intestinalis]
MSLPEELKNECTAAFEIFTKDSTDGKLGADELGKVMRMLGQSPSDDEVQEIIRDFAEGDTLALDEFLDFMAKQLNGGQDKREEDLSKEFKLLLKETFRWYDTDADGIISWSELKTALKNTGEKIEDWEIDELMKDGDENMDKHIDFDEWINMMKELEGQIQC